MSRKALTLSSAGVELGMPEATRMWPVGLDAVKREFGDPHRYIMVDGTRVLQSWPDSILTRLQLPAPLHLSWDQSVQVLAISCHHMVAASLGSILRMIHYDGLWHELEPYGGCYCWRSQRGGARLSLHAWGAAVDFRVTTCPLGETGDMPPAIVEAFEAQGWTWGGRWKRPDAQHFQAAGGM